MLSTYHCLKLNHPCLTILPTTRDCPGLSSLLWWEHSKHYFDTQNMYLHLLSRQITLLELNLHNYLEIFLWKFVWKFVFRLNSWKTDKAYMSPAIWQLGKWRQHIFKQLFSLLQLVACTVVPDIIKLPEVHLVWIILFWNYTYVWHCLLFWQPSLQDEGELCCPKELKLLDIFLADT